MLKLEQWFSCKGSNISWGHHLTASIGVLLVKFKHKLRQYGALGCRKLAGNGLELSRHSVEKGKLKCLHPYRAISLILF